MDVRAATRKILSILYASKSPKTGEAALDVLLFHILDLEEKLAIYEGFIEEIQLGIDGPLSALGEQLLEQKADHKTFIKDAKAEKKLDRSPLL